MAAVARGHWGIENKLRYVLDLTCERKRLPNPTNHANSASPQDQLNAASKTHASWPRGTTIAVLNCSPVRTRFPGSWAKVLQAVLEFHYYHGYHGPRRRS